jgi:hypothetical protein
MFDVLAIKIIILALSSSMFLSLFFIKTVHLASFFWSPEIDFDVESAMHLSTDACTLSNDVAPSLPAFAFLFSVGRPFENKQNSS